MKVFITGGTGFVGSAVTQRLLPLGHEVTLLTRSAEKGRRALGGAVQIVEGDPTGPGPWQRFVPGHQVILNLAGTSIFTLWTTDARRHILGSRVLTTRHLVDALEGAGSGVTLLNASAVGYYGAREDDQVLDESAPRGDDFPARVSVAWETEARRAEAYGARVVLCRFGIVLGRNGGALGKMLPAFRAFLASPLGGGRQWFPWIHEEDLFQILLFLAERPHVSGPVNCVAPQAVRNEEMTLTLSRVLERPLFLPAVPEFILRTLLGEFGDMLLKGQRAVPRRLQEAGFTFRFPELEGALRDLIRS